ILRVPVAVAIFAASYFYATFTGLLPQLSLASLAVNGVGGFLLVSIPTFILMAELMNRSTITERIYSFANGLVGHVRGGLAHVNVLTSLIFAGMSGSAIADIAGLGRIQIRAMTQAGYSLPLSAALTAASATIGPVLPPSIIMVVFASMAQVSVGAMFLGGVVPALIMAAAMSITVALLSLRHGEWVKQPRATWNERGHRLMQALPALLTPAILLVGFLSGYWTPTEAGAVASLWAFLIAKYYYRDLSWRDVGDVLKRTAVSSGNILLIFAAAHMLSQIVALEGLATDLSRMLQTFTDSPTVVLLLINALMFIGGMLMEPTPFLLIMTPIIVKIAPLYDLNILHVGVMCVVNLMIGTLTPPFAIALFAVSDVAKVPFLALVRATLPFYLPLIATVLITMLFPQLVLFVPTQLFGF
ncbi:MAG: TRAP transporter large permease, partial [Hyphomicrobiaceae bacterium]|nr:TRAP transporter large permease [Hyphomicrobiaceae bacterium]